jgi:ABC-type multidrug transport system fused ATPase/permease subunit
MYFWDYVKAMIDIHGRSCAFLRVSLMQAYLDLSKQSREKVTPADIVNAVDSSAYSIAQGYVAVLNIFFLIGRLITIEIFIILFQHDPFAIGAGFVMICLLTVFAILRATTLQRTQEKAEEKHIFMETLVCEATQKYQLVHSYNIRAVVSTMFDQACRSHNKERIAVHIASLSTIYITRFLSSIFVGTYIVVKAPAVLSGELSLGIFLAVISIFTTTLCETMSDLNSRFLQLVEAFGPLKEFTTYMNLPSDLLEHQRITQERRRHTWQSRRSLSVVSSIADMESQDHTFKTDQIPIVFADCDFEYSKQQPVLKGVSLSLKQGQMVALTGPPKSGKSTFMQLLSHGLCPTSGRIMVPSHLSCLHILHEPIFFRASIFTNLCLGLPRGDAVDVDRVCEILKMCDVEEIVDVIKQEIDEMDMMMNYDIAFEEASEPCSDGRSLFRILRSSRYTWHALWLQIRTSLLCLTVWTVCTKTLA